MRVIYRRAKDTSHLVISESKNGSLYLMLEFPALLIVIALCSIIGLAKVKEWWLPWSGIVTVLLIFYIFYRMRAPWEGETLADVQAMKVS